MVNDDEVEEEEEENSNDYVFVNGQKKLLQDVTDEDQERMTENERISYAALMGDDDDY